MGKVQLWIKRAAMVMVAATLLASCNLKRTDLPAFAPATQVVVTDYTPAKGVNPYLGQVWTVTDAGKIAQMAQLADANGKGWSDDNAANMTMQTGIEMHFTGGGLNQIFTIYPSGFSNSYGGSKGNLWSRPDSVGPTTQIKLIPDDEMDKLVADVRAIVKGVKPDPTPTPTAATPNPSKAAK